ncbi:hypothetical protein D9M71_412450 [compost metagenome]
MHIELDPQQLRCTGAGQVLVETHQLALILDRVPDGCDGLAHATDGLFHRLGAALELVGLLERRVDQHHCTLFLHWQQGPRYMPALAQVHGDARVLLHVVLEQAAVFGVLLVEQHTVLLAGQAPGQLRGTRVVAQLAVRVHLAQDAQVICGYLRQVVAPPETADTFQPLAGTRRLVALQVIKPEACVGVEVGKRLFLARHQSDEAGQHKVFEDVGVVTGVEGVTIVHGNSCKTAQFTLSCRRRQAPAAKTTTARTLARPGRCQTAI